MQDRMGFQGFIWFFGLVEDVNDPLQLGRVKVRIYNIHTFDEALIPKEDLPWAHVILPVTSAGFNEYGMSPTGIVVDSTVFGFFADGLEQQQPMILGTLPGIPQSNPTNVDPNNLSFDNHDVSRLARGINKLAVVKDSNRKGVEQVEPPTNTSYRAVFPFNKVFETKGGHVVEFDDSPGAERIHIYHKSGSYMEWFQGRKVDKINGTGIEINMLDKVVRVKGDYLLDIDGNYQTTVGGNMSVVVNGAISIVSNATISTKSLFSTSIDAGLSLSTEAMISTSMSTRGFMTVGVGTFMDVTVGGSLNIKVGAAASLVTGGQFLGNIGGLMSLNVGSTLAIGASENMYLLSGAKLIGVAPFIELN